MGGTVRKLVVRASMVVGVLALMSPALTAITVSPAGGSAQGLTASAPGITKTTIKIGILSDLTGPAASTFEDSVPAIEARFTQINKAGGIDGRKITWAVADSQSSPVAVQTAVKDLVQTRGVFMVVSVSALLFGGANYLHSAGIPVFGYEVDGPEWNEQPNTNMFPFEGTAAVKGPAYTDGGFWKATGATKISFIASNTPSSTAGIGPFEAAMKADGLSACDN